MIIITGYGRSGTRIIAELYQKSGYKFLNSSNSKLDDEQAGKINQIILDRNKPNRPQSTFERHYSYPRLMKYQGYKDLEIDMARVWISREIIKHCSFNLTLQAWIHNKFIPDHVIIVHRNLEKSIERQKSHYQSLSMDLYRNQLIHSYGHLFSTLLNFNIPYTIIRFPEDLLNPENLSLKLPEFDKEYLKLIPTIYNSDRK